MNSFRAALVLIAAGLLAACDNSPPPPAETPPAETPAVETPATQPTARVQTPAPRAPMPGTEVEVASEPPVPRPASERPLSDRDLAVLSPLFGEWAADLNNCERGAISISRTRFEGAENGCDITSLVDTGGWNFVATLSCTSQGQTSRERVGMVPLYAPTGEAVGLTYLDRDNQSVTVYRCD